MKTICILVLSLLIAGCDKQTGLKVNMTSTMGHDALHLLGAKSYVIDIDYSGTATRAELYVQAFKGGKLTRPYLSIGGIGGFTEPVQHLKLNIYVNIFDSRTSVMKLATQNKVEGDFFRFVTATKYDNTESGGGDKTISTDQMEIAGSWTWGSFPNPDLSKKFIPVGYIKSTKGGPLSAAIPKIIGDEIKKDAGFETCDYLIFYLELDEQPAPAVSSGGH